MGRALRCPVGGQDKELCTYLTVMAEYGRIQNDEIKKKRALIYSYDTPGTSKSRPICTAIPSLIYIVLSSIPPHIPADVPAASCKARQKPPTRTLPILQPPALPFTTTNEIFTHVRGPGRCLTGQVTATRDTPGRWPGQQFSTGQRLQTLMHVLIWPRRSLRSGVNYVCVFDCMNTEIKPNQWGSEGEVTCR